VVKYIKVSNHPFFEKECRLLVDDDGRAAARARQEPPKSKKMEGAVGE
jgi:hypothetical protein